MGNGRGSLTRTAWDRERYKGGQAEAKRATRIGSKMASAGEESVGVPGFL